MSLRFRSGRGLGASRSWNVEKGVERELRTGRGFQTAALMANYSAGESPYGTVSRSRPFSNSVQLLIRASYTIHNVFPK